MHLLQQTGKHRRKDTEADHSKIRFGHEKMVPMEGVNSFGKHMRSGPNLAITLLANRSSMTPRVYGW